jgi:outer membrane lipoprotein SlyB
MRNALLLALAPLILAAPPTAAVAKERPQWEYGGKLYDSYEACRRAKKRSESRAAVAGAVGGAATAAALGGNLGETALAAGAGAAAGAIIGKNVKRC